MSSSYSNKCVYSGSSRGPGNSRLSPPPERPASGDGGKGASLSHFQYSNADTGRSPAPENDPLADELADEYNRSAKLQPRLKHTVPSTN
ncbi:hypothetical protein ACHAPU_010458 [Fusarium lateritium]